MQDAVASADDIKLPGAEGGDPTAYRTTLVGLLQPWPVAAIFHVLAGGAVAALGLPLFALVWSIGSFAMHVAFQALYSAWLPAAETMPEDKGLNRLSVCSVVRSAAYTTIKW